MTYPLQPEYDLSPAWEYLVNTFDPLCDITDEKGSQELSPEIGSRPRGCTALLEYLFRFRAIPPVNGPTILPSLRANYGSTACARKDSERV